jgi:hypothetical protein
LLDAEKTMAILNKIIVMTDRGMAWILAGLPLHYNITQ